MSDILSSRECSTTNVGETFGCYDNQNQLHTTSAHFSVSISLIDTGYLRCCDCLKHLACAMFATFGYRQYFT